MEPRSFLRVEGLSAFAVAVGSYYVLGGPVWLFVALALAPDLAMVGYLAGPRIGSHVYNTAHTYSLPVALAAGGLWVDARLPVLVALVWVGHIGMDRFVGYGLKFDSGFKDTHLSVQPVPHPVLGEEDDD